MGLIARLLEANGIATVALANQQKRMEWVKPPRTLLARFPEGATAGPANDREAQRAYLKAALKLVEEAKEPGQVHTYRV